MSIDVHDSGSSISELIRMIQEDAEDNGWPVSVTVGESNGQAPIEDQPEPPMWDWNITLGFETAMPLTQVEEFAEELATEARKHIMDKENVGVVSVRLIGGPGGIE